MPRVERVGGFVPLGLVALVAAVFAIAPGQLWSLLGAIPPSPSATGGIRAALGLAAVLAGAAAALTWTRPNARRPAWRVAVSLLTAAEIVLFGFGSAYAFSQAIPTTAHPGPIEPLIRANLSAAGRYTVVDPDLFDPKALVEADEPDIGIVNGLASFGGYGAIVSESYAYATRTHQRAWLDPIALRQGVFQPLGLQVIATVPEEFLVPIAAAPDAAGHYTHVLEGPGVDPGLPGGNVPLPQLHLPPVNTSHPHSAVGAGGELGWYFGTTLRPDAAQLLVDHATTGQVIRPGIVTAGDKVRWLPARRLTHAGVRVEIPLGGEPAVGIVVAVRSGAPLGPTRIAVESAGHAYVVAGPLARTITPASWRAVGNADRFAVFRARYSPSRAWVQAPTKLPSAPTGAARVVSAATTSSTIAVVAPRGGLLARSVAFDPGWRAAVTSADGTSRSVAVQPLGLVQAVSVPVGRSTVTFTYRPVGFASGVALSAATAVVLLVLVVGAAVLRRRSRRSPEGPRPAAATGPGPGGRPGDETRVLVGSDATHHGARRDPPSAVAGG